MIKDGVAKYSLDSVKSLKKLQYERCGILWNGMLKEDQEGIDVYDPK